MRVFSEYLINYIIKQTNFSTVFLCTSLIDNELYVIKQAREKGYNKLIHNEIKVLNRIKGHIKQYRYNEQNDMNFLFYTDYHITDELCDLSYICFPYIKSVRSASIRSNYGTFVDNQIGTHNYGTFADNQTNIRYSAQDMIGSLKKVIEFLHSINVSHNDIKPENIIIEANSNKKYIIDFGLSIYDTRANMHNYCGTNGYKISYNCHKTNDIYACFNTIYNVCKLTKSMRKKLQLILSFIIANMPNTFNLPQLVL